MVVRRAFFVWQFAAIVVLPVWLTVGWAIWGPSGGDGVIRLTPFLLVLMTVVGQSLLAVVFSLRGSVRRARAVSWRDVAALTVLAALLIGVGFFGPATGSLAVLAIVAFAVACWSGLLEFVRELRMRVRATLDALGVPRAPRGTTPIDAGEFVVVHPSR